MNATINQVVNSISSKMGEILGVRVYVSITDHDGDFIYSDSVFDQYKEFIKKFVRSNFDYLNQGDHSIPMSSENIMFFKTTNNTITILYNPKGRIGQLLAFKSIMNKYHDSFESCAPPMKGMKAGMIEKAPPLSPLQMEQELIPIHRKKLYDNIKPILSRDLKKRDKFDVAEYSIITQLGGNHDLLDIIESVDIDGSKVLAILHDFLTKKLINFEEHEFIKVQCPECKNSAYSFIPKYILDKFERRIRVQLFPEGCNHAFVAFIDKKLKMKTMAIEKLLNVSEFLDLSKLSLEKLISFFGQDVIFNMFHALFYNLYVVFIGEDEVMVKKITDFLKPFFFQLEYERQVFCIDRAEFENNTRIYRDFLVIDLDSHVAIDLYENEELFGYELKLFKESEEAFLDFYRNYTSA